MAVDGKARAAQSSERCILTQSKALLLAEHRMQQQEQHGSEEMDCHNKALCQSTL